MTTLACDLSAIPPEQRPIHEANSERLFKSAQKIEELTDDYAFHLPASIDMITLVAQFISYERLCCPFFHFALEVQPETETVRFLLKGNEQIKTFIAEQIIHPINNT